MTHIYDQTKSDILEIVDFQMPLRKLLNGIPESHPTD